MEIASQLKLKGSILLPQCPVCFLWVILKSTNVDGPHVSHRTLQILLVAYLGEMEGLSWGKS